MNIEPWWPNGHGKQKLYKLVVDFLSSDTQEHIMKTVYVGFRTVELVQDPIKSGMTLMPKVKVIGCHV